MLDLHEGILEEFASAQGRYYSFDDAITSGLRIIKKDGTDRKAVWRALNPIKAKEQRKKEYSQSKIRLQRWREKRKAERANRQT